MKQLLQKYIIFLLLTFPSKLLADGACSLTSPHTGIRATVEMSTNVPFLIIKDATGTKLSKVQLGFSTDEEDFSTDITLVGTSKPKSFTERYHAFHGKRAEAGNVGRRMDVNFKNRGGTPFTVEIRVYDDGVAFRYEQTDATGKSLTFTSEQTNYEMPATAHRWLQPFNTSYEADFPYQKEAGATGIWGYPALFEADGVFTLITEANIGRSYCSTHLDNTNSANRYKVSYPFPYEGYNRGKVNPTCTGPWVSPWRVLIIGSLKSIVESTLVEDVSEPCLLTNTDFIKPGRAAWVYWAYNHGTKDYKICCQYVDLAAQMGWEYVLFDWEWESMGNGGTLEDAVRYAKSKGIKPMIWYHSNDPKMQNHNERIKELQWHKKMGIAGIKVDFFESDKQHTMQYFADILEDAAEYGIMVNFHGCTIPRGWSRTYPNLMSQEAVFGAEQYNNGAVMTSEGARINCLLPYTRNVIGPMDYTPVAFTDSQHPHTTTFAHELALSVAFESGIQHWADRPEGFYALPEEAQQHMRNVPVAWDDTRFLGGYPGKAFIVARRKADTWYVGGLNGESNDTTFTIPLSFLGKGRYEATLIGDGTGATLFSHVQSVADKRKTLTIKCLGKGGFVLTLRPKKATKYFQKSVP